MYLVGVVAFGLWVGRDQKGAADYMLGDRNIAWWGLLFSIVATETSTVTFLSIPGFAWSRDFTFIQLPLGSLIGRFLVVAVLLPHYFSGEYFTAYEVLRKRFGGAVGQAASFIFIVTRSLADGLRLFLTAIVVQEMAGLSLPLSVALVGVTTIVYTFAGGMKAVVWTDVAQFVTIYVVGAIVAFVLRAAEAVEAPQRRSTNPDRANERHAMPRIVCTAHLRRHVDCPELEVSGRNVAEVLTAAFAVVPQVRGYVLDEQGEVRKHVAIYVDGRRISDRVRLTDPVAPESEVWILQALSGG